MSIRSANIYVTPQLHRWLSWLAEVDGEANADTLAERLMRAAVLTKYPNIEQVESEYQRNRGKVNDEAINKLKANETTKTGN